MRKYIALGLGLVVIGACNPNAALRPKEKGVVTTVGAGALGGLYIGALSDFTIAWSGAGDESNFGHEGHVGLSALFTDELTSEFLDEFTFRRALDTGQATPANTQLSGIFNDISASLWPSHFSTSSVCSPRSGARRCSTGESDRLIGMPTCT